MILTQILENIWGRRRVVFTVPLADDSHVYMEVYRSQNLPFDNAFDKQRFVVIVDTEKFLALWKAEPNPTHPEIAHGNPASWQQDSKFPQADAGFREGFCNPVPLAKVSCEYRAERVSFQRKFFFFIDTITHPPFHYLNIENGVTRTIWLLAHGCKTFPVECDLRSAHPLHELAGVPGTNIATVAELLPIVE